MVIHRRRFGSGASKAVITAAGVLAFSTSGCSGESKPGPDAALIASQAPPAAAQASSAKAVEYVEYSYASTYTTQGVYVLSKAQPGDLMIFYLTDISDFQMPSGWTQIGDTIVLYAFGYPVKGFFRVRQEGDPTTYSIAQTTGFLAVYRNVDPVNPIASYLHSMSESQTPPTGNLVAPLDGSAAAYFFIGLYHSDILAPAGYVELYGCRHYEGSSHDTGMGHRLGLTAGANVGGNIFIAAMDCTSPGPSPYKEAVLHLMLRPAGAGSAASLPSGLRLQRE